MQPVLLDTGVIVALLDRRESKHDLCGHVVKGLGRPMVTCEAVITEGCHLLDHITGAAEDILANVEKKIFQVRFELPGRVAVVNQILRKYRDTPADFADACLIAMADALDTGDILTLDSDFAHYRWRRTRRFNMLIPLR